MIKQRVITALFLIPITIAALYYLPPYAFSLLTALIALVGAWEWSHLMGLKTTRQCCLYLVVVAVLFLLVTVIPIVAILFATFIWWLIAALLVILYPRASQWWSRGWYWRSLMGFMVIVPCWVAINYIRSQEDGFCALLFLFVLIWGADSAAYFVGMKWGKHKLAPQVSPGKSIEGLIGALVFSGLIATISLWLCGIPIEPAALGHATFAYDSVVFSVGRFV